jgi:transcriptional regulator with XRE-family HTH domain
MRTDRIKQVRESRSLSQQDLADRAGLSLKQIWRYENGESEATAGAITAIAKTLEVSTDYLLGLSNEPTGYLREQDLSSDEWLLIQAFRDGRTTDLLKVITGKP